MFHKAALFRGKKNLLKQIAYYSSSKHRRVIAIRREDQSVWERRAPFSPTNVNRLVRQGVKVIVQPSNRRAYPMQSYINAGAVIQEDISEAGVIFGVKQVPVDLLIPNKTYCFFSHTIKAQEANMPMLDAILAKNIRLIDYEKLMDNSGNRVVAFGKYAGVAGMINILHGLGLRLLALGHHTPFMHIGPAHNYRSSSMARQAIRDAGYEVSLGMMPKSLGPLTFVFTGSGNVSQGSQEIFQELPHEYVPPEMLRKVAEHGSPNKIYGCEVRRRHHLVRKNGGGYDPQEYEEHPERYISIFAQKIAPYTSVLVNCIYWAVDSPKLLTIPDAKHLLLPSHTPWLPTSVGAPALPHRMLAICDISADPGGSIEFMNECTTIDTPFCLYDADRNKDTKSFKGPGVLVCSIDNMPTQLPRESTDFFGDLLYPYSEDIMSSDASRPLEDHKFSQVVQGAIITSNGKLTPPFEYINELRMSNNRSRHKVEGHDQQAPIVILGSGLVSAPVVEYLARDKNVAVTIASQYKEEADALAEKYGVRSEYLQANDENALAALASKSRVVVSLLPYELHGAVARACVRAGAHMVTASYVRPEVQELHDAAKDAGVTLLNEIGLDPGIDHLLALECIHDVQNHGGRIDSFVSYCGGLPAPEFSDNALRYKFSWNPRGVLLNTISAAKYLSKGQIVEVLSGGELMSVARELDFLPGFAFEGFPNRDSTKYSSLYGIEDAHTMFRGTLRYRGFAETIKALQLFGFIDTNPHPSLHPEGPQITWRQFACELLGLMDSSIFYENLRTRLVERIGAAGAQAVESLGFLSDEPVVKCGSPLDTISHYLSKRLQLEKDETDFVVLRHEIGVTWSDGRRERREVTMTVRGEPAAHTAMARTVGLPTAVAAKMVLDGEIQERGVVLPFAPVVYKSLLSRLRADGITAREQTAGRETGRCMSVAAMQALHRLRECRLLCDAIVRADDGAAFPVHRAILSACSPYFLALFTTTLHSREQSDVQISGVRSEILLLLIEYAYLRRIDVTDTNVHELLMTADYLAFLGVLQLCCDHLRVSLSPKNCLGIMMFARRVFCYKLEADARRYLLRYFVTVATQSDEFLHLALEELNSVILEDELNVKSEEAVWESVLRWVNYDPDARWQHTVKLMGSIRLGLLDTQFFLENVKDHPYVTGNENSRPIIIETLKFLYDLEMIAQRDGEVATPEIARPRVPHEVLFAIGGWSGGSPTAFIETYDTRADRWIKVEEVDPAGPRAYHGTAVLGYCIYVIGGFDGMDYFNSCRCFDAVTKIWREVAPMNARRCYVSVAVIGETIYAMGGYDGHHRQNTAEKFNHRTNQWSLVAPMNAQRSDASAAALENKIYITGGFNGQECMNSVEMYDPDSNQWTTLAPMRSRRSGVSCIAYHNKIYVIGGFNGISRMCSGEVYDPATNAWSPVPDMYNPRSNFAIEVIDDMIFAIGGFNGVTTIYHVECYDEKTNEWYEATDMNIYRSALSACVIMGLPNVYDYIHKHRERLMEEKRQKILLSETARHPQHRTALPDVHLMEDNDDMLEQLGLMENQNINMPVPPPPPPPPPQHHLQPQPMEQDRN